MKYSKRGRQDKPLSDAHVPIIRRGELEETARDFLQCYHQEALYKSMPVDPNLLASRMGLSFQIKHITSKFSVFGQIFFADCRTEYYDKASSIF